MQESVIYQDILQEGIQKGIQQGIQKERKLVLRLLTIKLGKLSADHLQQIKQLPLSRLEALGEALLGFSRVQDLGDWLANEMSDVNADEAGGSGEIESDGD